MTTCLRASLLLAASTLKVGLLALLGLASGLVLAPVVVGHVVPSWASSVGWSPVLDEALGSSGSGAGPDLASWAEPTYLRTRWAALSAVLDD